MVREWQVYSRDGVPGGSANAILADQHEGVWISYPGHGLFHAVDNRVVESMTWPWSKPGMTNACLRSYPIPCRVDCGLDSSTAASHISRMAKSIKPLATRTVWLPTRFGIFMWITKAHFGPPRKEAQPHKGRKHLDAHDQKRNALQRGSPGHPGRDASSSWLSRPAALVRVDRGDLQAWVSEAKHVIHGTLFDGSDGFKMHAMLTAYSPVVQNAPDGKLWFAHHDGVSVIDPHHLRLNSILPPVHIEQITADGKTYAPAEGLRLPPRVRDLAIDYTALSLVAPEKVRFRFKLEGQDEDWREVVNDRQVQYSNLAPGTYRFRVIASNNSAVWNEEGAVLDFAIAPAYYQTNWFRVLCVLTFLAMFWTVYQMRVRALERHQGLNDTDRDSRAERTVDQSAGGGADAYLRRAA